MKILQVTNTYPTDKLPVYGIFIKEQIDSLREIGFASDLYFINGREKGKFEYIKALFKLRKLMNNYDIIHVHHFLSAVIVLAAKPEAKVVVTFLSDGIREFIKPDNFLFNKFVKKNLYKFILRNSDARIFKNAVPSSFSHDPFSFYLPNGVNTDLFYPMDKNDAKRQLGLDASKTYILFVSLVDINRSEKRYDIFCKTLNILREKYKRTDIEELKIVNVERNKVPLYFNAASVHLLTSDFEGSPNSVKESLACNTPVVSTDVGNVKNMLSGLHNSFVSMSNHPEQLAELLVKSLNIRNIEDSRKHIIDMNLDIRNNAFALKNIYEKLFVSKSI